eukprot:gb/GECG01001895.1/.p1 GENE.gb/GECG01001895.1/~~gb/GECG01001895.1/.p1  ORF type:complete len:829 (+),score=148.27 gb/GECG01001895.1/:1-2487(+)
MSSKVPNAADLMDMAASQNSMNGGSGHMTNGTKKEDVLPEVPIEHLDYDFVGKCENWKELRDVLLVLRSGKEGKFPHLEKVVENRMLQFMPEEEKRQWFAIHGGGPDRDEVQKARQDVSDWIRRMKSPSSSSSTSPVSADNDTNRTSASPNSGHGGTPNQNGNRTTRQRPLPPPRGYPSQQWQQQQGSPPVISKQTTATLHDSEAAPKQKQNGQHKNPKVEPKAAKLGEYYNKWDKVDVDQLLEESEVAETNYEVTRQQQSQTKASSGLHTDLKISVDPSTLSEKELEYNSNNEKGKGNDCFRAGDLENAHFYYSRALYFKPQSPLILCNRAQVYLKLHKYRQAEDDCTFALELDPQLLKAWVRRGKARHSRGSYKDAIEDFKKASELEPSNKEITRLMRNSEVQYNQVEGKTSNEGASSKDTVEEKESFQRIPIEEDEGGDQDNPELLEQRQAVQSTDRESTSASNELKPSATMKRVTIEESDSEDDDEEVGAASKKAASPIATSEGASGEETPNRLKEAGNSAFKYGNVREALEHYTSSLKKDPKQPAVYSNRAMVQLQLQNYEAAVADCRSGLDCAGFTSTENLRSAYAGQDAEYDVIRKLIVKLLFRRGLGLKSLGQLEDSLRDMQDALELEPSNERVAKEVETLRVETTKKGRASESNASSANGDSEETAERGVDEQQPQHTDAFETATRISGKLLSQIAVPGPPQTAYEFESVCNSFRNDLDKLSKYVKQVKPVKLKKLFKRPIESDTLSRLIHIAKYITETEGDSNFALDLLKGLAKTPNFSMTAMMLESSDQSRVQRILSNYSGERSNLEKVREAYKLKP